MALGGIAALLPARRRGHGVHAALVDHRRYEQQIDRLQERHLSDGGMHRLVDGEIDLGVVVTHRSEVARLLARTVAAGEYKLRPATVRTILVEGKKRDVFDYPLLDLIVHGVVADVLGEAVEPSLSDCLHSYRAGTSWLDGVRSFATYVRRHRRAHPDPRTRGLYVLRRDVDSYTDSIPLGATSPLWRLLDDAIASRGRPLPTETDRELIAEVVRPRVLTPDGAEATRLHGVATGQPISCVCFNVYLAALDRELAAIPGAFYARYSDDVVFAHPDPAAARDTSDLLDARLAAVGLKFKPDKRHDFYLTGAGRPSADWPAARGTTTVRFLGMRVGMEGTVGLGRRKAHGFLRDARRRVCNTTQAMAHVDKMERGRAVAGVLNAMLDPDEAQVHGLAAPLLAQVVTDRRQLDQFDRELAQIVAGNFRRMPYRKVRKELGLASLRRARDNGRTR